MCITTEQLFSPQGDSVGRTCCGDRTILVFHFSLRDFYWRSYLTPFWIWISTVTLVGTANPSALFFCLLSNIHHLLLFPSELGSFYPKCKCLQILCCRLQTHIFWSLLSSNVLFFLKPSDTMTTVAMWKKQFDNFLTSLSAFIQTHK